MQASWVDGFDQRVLLRRFVHLANTGGLIGFDGEAKNFVTLLRSMVQFPENVPWGVRYRNRSVHGGMSTGDVEGEVYQLKRCVEHLIQFHIGNRFGFKTMEQACNFLDLPHDDELLRGRLKSVKDAIAFRESGKT